MQIGLDFGCNLFELSPDALTRIARQVEDCGFDYLASGDHLIMPEHLPLRDMTAMDKSVSEVDQSSPDAKLIFRQGAPMPDVFQWFTHMAAATSRLEFATAIYVLPLRDPIVAARAAATFDLLSGGRLHFGVGAGWIPGEYEIAGVDFATRGRRMNESIAVIRRLWLDEVPEFSGELFSFPPARFEPKPIRRPGRVGPPILIGGESEAALRRAARISDGWCAREHTPQSLREHIDRLAEMRSAAGRAPDERFIIQCRTGPDTTAGEVQGLAEAGADQVMAKFWDVRDEDWFMREIERLGAILAPLPR